MQTVVLTLKESLNASTTAPYIAGINFAYTFTNNSVNTLQFALLTIPSGSRFKIFVDSILDGEFFSDSGGTVSLGKEVTYTTAGDKVLYFRGYRAGTIRMSRGELLQSLGQSVSTSWGIGSQFKQGAGVIVRGFDLAQLTPCTNIEAITISEGVQSLGSIDVLKTLVKCKTFVARTADYTIKFAGTAQGFESMPLMRTYAINGIDTIDMKYFTSPVLGNFSLVSGLNKYLRYTGDGNTPLFTGFNGTVIEMLTEVGMPAAEMDLFLKALSAGLPTKSSGTQNISIKGTRTSASDAYVATLTTKGYNLILS